MSPAIWSGVVHNYLTADFPFEWLVGRDTIAIDVIRMRRTAREREGALCAETGDQTAKMMFHALNRSRLKNAGYVQKRIPTANMRSANIFRPSSE